MLKKNASSDSPSESDFFIEDVIPRSEVREHNNFAKRMPVVEEQIKVINHRIEDLEEYHKEA